MILVGPEPLQGQRLCARRAAAANKYNLPRLVSYNRATHRAGRHSFSQYIDEILITFLAAVDGICSNYLVVSTMLVTSNNLNPS